MLQFPLLKLLCVLHTWVIFLALILCVCSRVVNMVAHGSLSTITRTQSHKSQQSFLSQLTHSMVYFLQSGGLSVAVRAPAQSQQEVMQSWIIEN